MAGEQEGVFNPHCQRSRGMLISVTLNWNKSLKMPEMLSIIVMRILKDGFVNLYGSY